MPTVTPVSVSAIASVLAARLDVADPAVAALLVGASSLPALVGRGDITGLVTALLPIVTAVVDACEAAGLPMRADVGRVEWKDRR